MTTDHTPSLDRAAMEARLAAITPGEWFASPYCGKWCVRPADNLGMEICDTGAGKGSEEDAEFIAHAPADVRALLEENARLSASLDAIRRVAGLVLAGGAREEAVMRELRRQVFGE